MPKQDDPGNGANRRTAIAFGHETHPTKAPLPGGRVRRNLGIAQDVLQIVLQPLQVEMVQTCPGDREQLGVQHAAEGKQASLLLT
jgi:hypothetical protein